ncbi:mechanosensitive ion channel domain-containing protein [Legionella impletisoli]|uniref:Mechanosensitive ion channel protein MscS n=1 Tax=Legionella impletisoli TaxID=343510 RepID=A0A917N9S4_9GAMM|nr:mechanosensitive ion channel domain-containing protein [Legionella impletisoli]GGI81441.1 mechanosensitive ion channel protein MscS [Legionella impletisoli]
MRKRHHSNNILLSGVALRRYALLQYFCFCLLLFSSYFISPANAAEDLGASQLIEYLTQEKSSLSLKINSFKPFAEPTNLDDFFERKKQNDALLAVTQIKIVNLENFLIEAKKEKERLSQKLKKLQQSPLNSISDVEAQEKSVKLNNLIEINTKTIELIHEDLTLAKKLNKILLAEQHDLRLWKSETDLSTQISQVNQRLRALDHSKSKLYEENISIQALRNNEGNETSRINHEAKLLLNNQFILLIQTRIAELEHYKKQLKAEFLLLKNQDVKSLESVINTYRNAINQLDTVKQSLTAMQSLVDHEQMKLNNKTLNNHFKNLQSAIKKRLEEVSTRELRLQTQLAEHQQQLKKQLAMRQNLAEYHLTSWPEIAHEFLQIPIKFYHYLSALMTKSVDNYAWQSSWSKGVFWGICFFILIIAFGLRILLNKLIQEKERQRLTGHLYDGLLVLIKRNIPQLTSIVLLVTMFYLNNIASGNYRLLLNLMFVWLAFRNLILIARLMLLERISDSSGKDVRLYHRLKWLFLAGGWATALMVFSHQYPLTLLMQDIFNRFFMLFLLSMAVVIWKSKEVIPYLLRPILKAKKRYIRSAIVLLVNLIPITLLTTAVIGLIGYINLAWTMSRYQAYLLLVITGYVVARGLISDALELLSEWMISSLRNGWLWIEVLLKPFDKILRILLWLVSILILFQLYGWYSDSWVMTHLKVIGHYPLVNLSGIHITLFSFLEFLVLLFIFLWASKWTREFCYRWLYRNARDAGIRNSLSAFTQYGVILIGSFITLRALGLDFSGMSMILGGLAVGMGFGLRDFASNIIGGIMLLIERPVREGDLITLGEYEGRVAHIGIRSMRVSSWDNMEVLIPNAETFNKPFTNWTHQDNVVRSVIPIKVSRGDEPVMVQQLILDVLAIIPEILDNPPPQVFLKHIDEALIEFEARYYINVQEHTRFEVRSNVLFAIMAQFKAAGIKPPIPPLSIEFKEDDHGSSLSRVERS